MVGCASQNAANSVQMRGLGGRVGRPFLEPAFAQIHVASPRMSNQLWESGEYHGIAIHWFIIFPAKSPSCGVPIDTPSTKKGTKNSTCSTGKVGTLSGSSGGGQIQEGGGGSGVLDINQGKRG